MRTAPSRVRRLLGMLVVAVSVGWLLLRRRTGSAPPLPAIAPPTEPAPLASPEVLATDAGLTVEPLGAPAPDVLATDAELTVEPAAPEPLGAPAPDVLATDAGLTATGPVEDTMVLPRDGDPEAPAGTDNLRAIRGIGPALDRTLHELGITTYRQIADLHGAELEAVRHRLEAFSARIEREDWAGQARELHRAKYGETL